MPINHLVVEQLKQYANKNKIPAILNSFSQLEKASSKEKQIILNKLRTDLNSILVHDQYTPFYNAVYDALIAIAEYKPIDDTKDIKEAERKVYKGVVVVHVSHHGEAEAGQVLLPTFQQYLKDEVKHSKEEDKHSITTSTGHKFNLKWLVNYYHYNKKYLNHLKSADRPDTLLNPFTNKPFNFRDFIRIIAEADKYNIKIRDIEQLHWEVNIYDESLIKLAKSKIDLARTILASPTLCSFMLPMQRSPDGSSLLHWIKPKEFVHDCLVPILNAQPDCINYLNESMCKQLHGFMSRWGGSETYVPRLFAMLDSSPDKSLRGIVLANFAKLLEQCDPNHNDKLKQLFLIFVAIQEQKFSHELDGIFKEIKVYEYPGAATNKLRLEFIQRLKAQTIEAYSSKGDKAFQELMASFQIFKIREKLALKINQLPDSSLLKSKVNNIYEIDSKFYEATLTEFNAEFKKLTEDARKKFLEQSINSKKAMDNTEEMARYASVDFGEREYIAARIRFKHQLSKRVEQARLTLDEIKREIDSSCSDQEYYRFSIAMEKFSKEFNAENWNKTCEDFKARESIFELCQKIIMEHQCLNVNNTLLLFDYAATRVYQQSDFKQAEGDLKKMLNDFDRLIGLTTDLVNMLEKYTPRDDEKPNINTIQQAITRSFKSLLEGKSLSEAEKDIYETIDNIRKSAENQHLTMGSLRFLSYIGMQPASPLVTLCKDMMKEFWRPDFLSAGMYRP